MLDLLPLKLKTGFHVCRVRSARSSADSSSNITDVRWRICRMHSR